MTKRYGVVDIGTLKVKLQIAEVQGSQTKIITESSTLTCLGCHMEENGNRPIEKNLQTTIEELKKCKRVMEEAGVDRVRVVSTHALREMGKVGKEIAQVIKKKVGLTAEVISQQEEAELFYRAVLTDFKTDDDFMVMDQGGGSVQIIIGNRKKLKQFFLLKMGSSTLWDKFTPKHKGDDFPSREEVRLMKEYILEQLQPIPAKIKTPIVYGSTNIIDIFKVVGLKMAPFMESASHPYKVKVTEMERLLKEVLPISYDKREERFGYPQKYYMYGIDKAFMSTIELSRKAAAPFVVPSNANIGQGLLLSIAS